MYKRKNNQRKTGILTEKERSYLSNPSGTTRNNQGTTRRNIDKKVSELDSFDLSFDLIHLLSEERVIQLTKELMLSLPIETREIFFESHRYLLENNKETEDAKNQKSRENKKFRKVLKRINAKNLTLDEIHSLRRLSNLNKLNSFFLKKELNRLYKSETFIMRRKINLDIKFILGTKERLEMFRWIYRQEQPFNLDRLYKNFSKERYSIQQFCERGIIMPAEKSKKDFISICRSYIKNRKAKEVSRFFQEYEIYPFVSYFKRLKKVKLNPYYDFFKINQKDFQRGSSMYYSIAQPLRSLLIDNSYDYPKEFYPS